MGTSNSKAERTKLCVPIGLITSSALQDLRPIEYGRLHSFNHESPQQLLRAWWTIKQQFIGVEGSNFLHANWTPFVTKCNVP